MRARRRAGDAVTRAWRDLTEGQRAVVLRTLDHAIKRARVWGYATDVEAYEVARALLVAACRDPAADSLVSRGGPVKP